MMIERGPLSDEPRENENQDVAAPSEDRPCSFDHHGYCQEHDDFSGDGCEIAKARALLDSLADGDQK